MATSTIQKCDKHVFLLGAGFSAGYGSPVMRNFMANARDKFFFSGIKKPDDPLKKCYEKMMTFQQECRNCSWVFNRDWDNIEELYSQADLLRLARYPNETDANNLCREIAWVIWDVYRGYLVNEHPPMNYVLETAKNRNRIPIIITTNYDVLCEIGITTGEPYWECYYPGFKCPGSCDFKRQSILNEDINVTIGPTHGKSAPIIKLHGSVNWFQKGDSSDKLYASVYFGKQRNHFGNDCLVGINDPSFGINEIKKLLDSEADPIPAIIPPMLGKMSVSSVISCQWQSAILCLETAAHITIIGYSFPETDVFMTRLLAEGLKNNNGLESIEIVDIQDEILWNERLNRFFTPTLRHTKLKYRQCSAEKYLDEIIGNSYNVPLTFI